MNQSLPESLTCLPERADIEPGIKFAILAGLMHARHLRKQGLFHSADAIEEFVALLRADGAPRE
jgi:hypothetical protein